MTNSPRVTLEQWRVLQAVIDQGGFAQAADFLHKSQSSVSYTIARLQEQLGYSLLIIEGRKAKLTERGEVLLRHSRHLLKEAVNLEALAQTLGQGWEPELTLVIDEAFPTLTLLKALKLFEPKSQGTRIQLQESVLSGGEEALLHNHPTPDLVLTPIVPKGYLADPLLNVTFLAVAAPFHPLFNNKTPADSKRLSRELQIVIRDSATNNRRDAGWLGSENRWTVSSVQSAIEIVLSGIGFAWLPKSEIGKELDNGTLKPISLTSGSVRTSSMFAVLGKRERTGPAGLLLLDILKTECKCHP